MKLNKNCVRDLLLFVEKQSFDTKLTETKIETFAKEHCYSTDEVIYCIQKLLEADFISGNVLYVSNKIHSYSITNITYSGHEFLDTIRDNMIWNKTKSAVSTFSDVSLSILSDVAKSIALKTLGLN